MALEACEHLVKRARGEGVTRPDNLVGGIWLSQGAQNGTGRVVRPANSNEHEGVGLGAEAAGKLCDPNELLHGGPFVHMQPTQGAAIANLPLLHLGEQLARCAGGPRHLVGRDAGPQGGASSMK